MPSQNRLVVAIDGPAGAGKSTVSRLVATALGLPILDTGAMYRCTGLKALRLGANVEDESAMGELCRQLHIAFEPGTPQRVLLDGEDVTTEIRTLEVSQAASRVSIHPQVRRELVARQQEIVAQGGLVLEGRDTTTVVAPQAQVKIFLTASAEERARRRWLEMLAEGQDVPLHHVVKEVVVRDYRDYTREDSPLMLAEDATIVETFGVTPLEVAEKVIQLARSVA